MKYGSELKTTGRAKVFFLFRLTLVCLVLFACSPSKTSDLLLRDPDAGVGGVIGRSVENRPIDAFVMGEGEDVILIMGAVHGDEKPGASLIRQLMRFLHENPTLLQGKRVLLIPVVNPDGFHRHSRHNANGVDLNRNFPASNHAENPAFGLEPLSEPETRAIFQFIERHGPNRIITIHSPLNCIDYDGPAKTFAEYLAEYSNLPVRRIGEKPGSLGSYAGMDLNIPVVTLELPEDVEYMNIRELWDRYGNLLLAAIHYPSVRIRTIRVLN